MQGSFKNIIESSSVTVNGDFRIGDNIYNVDQFHRILQDALGQLICLLNREMQDYAIEDRENELFSSNKHIVGLLFGEETEEPGYYIDRLTKKIRDRFHKRNSENVEINKPRLVSLPLMSRVSGFDMFEKRLCQSLKNAFHFVEPAEPTIEKTFSSLFKHYGGYEFLIFYFTINQEQLLPQQKKAIEYFFRFWKKVQPMARKPKAVAILKVEYTPPKKGWFERLLAKDIKSGKLPDFLRELHEAYKVRAIKKLEAIQAIDCALTHCLVFPEVEKINKSDINVWLENEFKREAPEYYLPVRNEFRELFHGLNSEPISLYEFDRYLRQYIIDLLPKK